MTPVTPFCIEIPFKDPLTIFAQFSAENAALLLDSAQCLSNRGHYSFIAVDPFLKLVSKNNKSFINNKKILGDPFELLETYWKQFPLRCHANLPPFQGGVAGLFGYDLCHHLEILPRNQIDDMNFPDMALGFYDVVIAFDLEQKRAWIFSSGYPETENHLRESRAKQRAEHLFNQLQTNSVPCNETFIPCANIHANFSEAEYLYAVEKVKEYIFNGDIFEANISQRFYAELPNASSAFELYQRLRKINPAPFAAFFKWEDMVIASASPERFLKLSNNAIEARPIKGTRPRGKTAAEDQKLAEELVKSEKDHAENVMIVDLLRNDISRVAENHSVTVPQLCGLESYPNVHHLVSVVHGKLQKNKNAIDLLRATFPGGSITGAPKIRAMEIIAEIEPTQRGPYCGSIGYIGFNGDMDCSILIRTFALKQNKITFQAGGAIVLDSNAQAEYEETFAKINALSKALTAEQIV